MQPHNSMWLQWEDDALVVHNVLLYHVALFNWHSACYIMHNRAPSAYSYLSLISVNGGSLPSGENTFHNISAVTCYCITIPFLSLWSGTKYYSCTVTFQVEVILACHLEDSKPKLPKLVVNEVFNRFYVTIMYGKLHEMHYLLSEFTHIICRTSFFSF